MQDNQGSNAAQGPVELPPIRTFNLWIYDPEKGDQQIAIEAHTIQTTEAGGLNILVFEFLPDGRPAQKLRVAYAPNHWRKIEEVMIEPSRILH